MKIKSRNGVYYVIEESPYTYKNKAGVEFYFSSVQHLAKFTQQVLKNRDEINESLSKRFKCPLYLMTLPDIALYRKIETRAFYVSYEGRFYKCPEHLTLGGEVPMKLILSNQLKNSTVKLDD